MPQEYLKCVEAQKKNGKSEKEAKTICAIAFYKRHGITVNEAHKRGMFNMKEFSEHQIVKNDDGTYNVLGVPIFEIGKHKGNKYDESWAAKMLDNFKQLKKNKWLPRIIIGHTSENGDEKPAVGFLDNLRIAGKTIYADYVNLRDKVFEALKTKAFPGRSVEVNPQKAKITALALLGGTEPYFQFEPVDINFKADPEGEWVEFDTKEQNVILDKLDAILNLFKNKKTNGDKEMTAEELKKLKEDVKAEVREEFEKNFDAKYAEKFKEEFGKEPDKFKKELQKQREEQFKEKINAVLGKIKETNLAPAIINGFFKPLLEKFGATEDKVKFAEDQEAGVPEMLEKFAETIAKNAAEKTLLVDKDEHTRFAGDDENPNLKSGEFDVKDLNEEQATKLHKKIQKYADEHKISYEEAAVKVYESL